MKMFKMKVNVSLLVGSGYTLRLLTGMFILSGLQYVPDKELGHFIIPELKLKTEEKPNNLSLKKVSTHH